MSERQVVGKLVSRMYANYVKETGRIPSGDASRAMEKKAEKVARRASRRKPK
jgi:hypothetical protein